MKNRIRELRQAHGIKQADLAKHLGVAQNTLSYWEQGKYDVDNTSLQKIADYFHCSVDCVLCRAEIQRQEITEDFFGELLSDHEKELIRAYRAQSDMQAAVDRLLNINQKETAYEKERKLYIQKNALPYAAAGGNVENLEEAASLFDKAMLDNE